MNNTSFDANWRTSQRNLGVDLEIVRFRKTWLNTDNFTMDSNYYVEFDRVMLLFIFFSIVIQIWIKSENRLKIQDGGPMWSHLCIYGFHRNQSCTMCLHLIETTKEVHYVCQISCQSDELRRKVRRGVDWAPSPSSICVTFFLIIQVFQGL